MKTIESLTKFSPKKRYSFSRFYLLTVNEPVKSFRLTTNITIKQKTLSFTVSHSNSANKRKFENTKVVYCFQFYFDYASSF